MFAEVAFSISTFQSFTYKVPSNLVSIAQVGLRVQVPFGNRSLSGIIISLKRNTSYDGDIKNILEIIDDSPVFTKELWALIEWISYYYITPIGKVFNSALSINISNNYKPQMNLYAQYIGSENKDQIENLKKNAPKQFQVYKNIKKASPTLLKISLLKNICSNPLSICRSLELKKLIKILKKDKKPTINDFSLHSGKKKIKYN